MFKKLFVTLALAGMTTLGFGQNKSMLWEISGKGLTKPSYLFGTIHLICPTDFTITEPTKKALSGTEQVYLELDMDDPQMMPKMQKGMMNTGGKSYKEWLKPEDYTLLSDYYKSKMGAGLDQLGMLKPLALMSMNYMTLLNCQPESYDMTFAKMASEQKKEVLGLETVESQFAIFDKIPVEKQATELVDMVRNQDKARTEFNQLITLYKAQDLDGLLKLMRQSEFSDMAGYEDALLNDRNANWIPTIEQAVKLKPTFIAVGAGHLGGDKGVIELLRKKGYTVKAVN
ncbi:TraB/GumN family protein [Spirosoma linguale]|uniref:GumN family protein n=1 Tax=Spirosoma linguale (strain ATCC 33905 / DSM 74 / LMG 10896 / Claus 1) TaxID=504472 RepID=D2QTZ0_SPILD|nr:GumN family protein [Spirosoma linguale DSM 74]